MTKSYSKRLFVLDTNVLMHDPSALFRFQEHDVYIPMMVLEELDRSKKGVSEVSRNVRQVSRFLDDLLADCNKIQIEEGIKLNSLLEESNNSVSGRLFFQTELNHTDTKLVLPGNTPDNDILSMALTLQKKKTEDKVTIVSKDINLRIKAAILGLHSEDYYNDRALDDVDLLYSGTQLLPPDFWDVYAKKLEAWQENGRSFYRICGQDVKNWYVNQGLISHDEGPVFIVRSIKQDEAVIEVVKEYCNAKNKVWGINSRNKEQNFALNLLMDQNIDFVSLLGAAGTGKTLIALAAGLAQIFDIKRYSEIIMTRVTVPVGEDIGFLPGSEEEKMTPWMGALMDNLEVLAPKDANEWGKQATEDLLKNKIKIRSLNFMRGRTFQNKYLIIDEAQNLTAKQMRTLITRSGPGTKVVCMGNVAQIDTPYLSETTSGLTYVVQRFKGWEHGGHVTLQRGERSRLADFANERL